MPHATKGRFERLEATLTSAIAELDDLGEPWIALRVDHARAQVAEKVRGLDRVRIRGV